MFSTKSDQKEFEALNTLMKDQPNQAELFYRLVFVRRVFEVDVKEFAELCFDEEQTEQLKRLLEENGEYKALAQLTGIRSDNLDFVEDTAMALNVVKQQLLLGEIDDSWIRRLEMLVE